jgi:hypothetical protein
MRCQEFSAETSKLKPAQIFTVTGVSQVVIPRYLMTRFAKVANRSSKDAENWADVAVRHFVYHNLRVRSYPQGSLR